MCVQKHVRARTCPHFIGYSSEELPRIYSKLRMALQSVPTWMVMVDIFTTPAREAPTYFVVLTLHGPLKRS